MPYSYKDQYLRLRSVQSFDGSAKLQGKEDNAKLKFYRLQELRWTRIVANDLENIPIGLIASWGSLLCCSNYNTHAYLVIGFAIFRYGRF